MKLNNIYNGDCIEILNKTIKKNSIDLVFADPPYNLSGNALKWQGNKTGGDWFMVNEKWDKMPDPDYFTFTEQWIKGCHTALKDNGSVITWGGNGGNSDDVAAQLNSGVTTIYSTQSAFAALKNDGSVVTWGLENSGGDSSSVSSFITSEVSEIFSTDYAFAALKDNGSIVTWGDDAYGGDSSAVADHLNNSEYAQEKIFSSTERAFAVIIVYEQEFQ